MSIDDTKYQSKYLTWLATPTIQGSACCSKVQVKHVTNAALYNLKERWPKAESGCDSGNGLLKDPQTCGPQLDVQN